MRSPPTIRLACALALSALALSAMAVSTSARAAATPINDPETELAVAKTELDNLLRRLSTAKEMSTRLGIGPQTVAADKAYAAAVRYFKHGEWRSSIRELNNYLNLTQVPAPKPYLASQYMLGRSYEELGEHGRGLRAYFRYIAAFLTAPEQNQDELLEVLRRMIPLAAMDDGSSKQMNELLASLTSVEFPAEARPVVLFIAAKAAANAGKISLAQTWLDTAEKEAKDTVLKQKTLYLKALIAINERDFERAQELLSEVIQLSPEKSNIGQYEKDLARLALARLAIHEKKGQTALKYYETIPEGSVAFKDATFESVYVHLDLKQDAQARSKAMLYLARYPQSGEALQLRMLLAYLDLRAGDLNAATHSIDANSKKLGETTQWMHQKFTGKSTVSHLELTDFLERTRGLVPTVPTVDAAHRLFGKLAETARQLADVRGEIRNLIYTIGRGSLGNLKPFWLNRAEQLAAIGEDLLKTGHRLAAAERHLYKERLSQVEWQELTASETRRTGLLTPAADARRRMMQWASYATFADLTKDVSEQYKRLTDVESELTSARYLSATMEKKDAKKDGRDRRIKELEAQVIRMNGALAETLEKLRTVRIAGFLAQSPHRAARKFLSQYALALKDESDTLARARQHPSDMGSRLVSDDATKAWGTWDFAAKELFRQLDDLDQDIATGLRRLLDEIAQSEAQHRALAEQLTAAVRALEGQVGTSLAYIVDQYSGAAERRLAKNRKWKADLDWLSYQLKAEEDRKLGERYELERQILKDQLTDLQQGILWKWPE